MKRTDLKTVTKTFRFAPDTVSHIKFLKDKSGESESDIVKMAIDFYMSEYKENLKLDLITAQMREMKETIDLMAEALADK